MLAFNRLFHKIKTKLKMFRRSSCALQEFEHLLAPALNKNVAEEKRKETMHVSPDRIFRLRSVSF